MSRLGPSPFPGEDPDFVRSTVIEELEFLREKLSPLGQSMLDAVVLNRSDEYYVSRTDIRGKEKYRFKSNYTSVTEAFKIQKIQKIRSFAKEGSDLDAAYKKWAAQEAIIENEDYKTLREDDKL